MSKPLILVLQLVALWLIMTAFVGEPFDYIRLSIGILIAVGAGVAFRRRVKK